MRSNRALKSAQEWARHEFGSAQLGSQARTHRLIKIAAAAASRPAGRLTEVLTDPAAREGAYRFMENEQVDPNAITHGLGVGCAERCRNESFVFVPVDGSSLTLPDPHQVRGLGAVGSDCYGQHGLQAMTAIAVTADGTAAGLLGQRLWARQRKAKAKGKAKAKAKTKHRRRRRLHEKETRYWLDVINDSCRCWEQAGAQGRLWFQLDRGGDFWEMLQWAESQRHHWVTVRVAYDRRVALDGGDYLWPFMQRQPVLGHYELEVPSGQHRQARRARFEVRAAPVTVWARARPSKKKIPIALGAVWAKEVSPVPPGEKPLQWMLFTTAPLNTFADAQQVIFGYTRRWRIEEFHRTWKSTCRVEETQLRGATRVHRWAVILAAVATRIQRLTQLARTAPEMPAAQELTSDEIDAVLLLRKPALYKAQKSPTIEQAVRWIAELGGYTGKSSGGPPGATTLSRGLLQIQAVAKALRNQRESSDE